MTLYPSNKDAEKGILSICLQWPEKINDVAESGGLDLFYDPTNRKLFSAMLEMHNGRRKVESSTVIAELRDSGDLDAVGGPATVAELLFDVASAALAPDFIRLATKAAKGRKIAMICEKALRSTLNGNEDPDAVAMQLDSAVKSVMLEISGDQVKTWPRVLNEFIVELEERVRERKATAGLSTGFEWIDKMTSGAKPGELWVIAARPGIGKTAYAMQIAQQIACKSTPVMFFSAEMEARELATRVIAGETKMDSLALQSGELAKHQLALIAEAVQRQMRLPIYVDDRAGMRLSDIAINARRGVSENGVKAVFVDYLQLVKEENGSRNREDAVRRLSGGLKQLAKELQIPVIALAQLNRQVEGKEGSRPKAAHLRDSGSIEQDASFILLLHRTGERTEKGCDVIEAILDKARGGTRGVIEYHFHGPTTKFSEQGPTDD